MKLESDFYTQSAVKVAPLLLGKILCRKWNNEIFLFRITETEAYMGESDTACHARCGKTARNSVMYEKGGTVYVYLCYGIHNLLNVVTSNVGQPEAVLIRGIEGFSGPGKLTKAMKIDRSLNGADLITSNEIWIESDGIEFKYKTSPRIGIDYASDEDRVKPWRFIVIKN